MQNEASNILQFLALSERLKRELRHSWLSDGRRESVAEHTWQMALIALLAYRHLEQQVEIGRVLKMILVHDLVEAIAGDVPYFEEGTRKELKVQRELAAIEEIRTKVPGETGQELFDLWHEFEARTTLEAKFSAALDHLEVQIQHNLADIKTWEPIEYDLVYTKMHDRCSYDPFLAALCAAVRSQAESKMVSSGIDLALIKRRIGIE
ncbi:putative hydrolase of HD superfamily [Bradyrhizobium sp. AZCC 1578]|jgi:putative hydrolase of HD superfamily|uniref:HD domain-containing protein n=1 Tax=Bradyrhizobium sp. AZCC 1578 TaxID=3117027 RepID=UPI002FEFC259